MNTLKVLAPALLLLLVVSFGNAQSNIDDHNKRMAVRHEAIRMKSEELMNGNTADRSLYTAEMEKSIEGAKRQHLAMHNHFTNKQLAIMQPYNDAIGKYHNNMLTTNNSLRAELAKPQPNEALVKQYSLQINQSAIEAEQQRQQMTTMMAMK